MAYTGRSCWLCGRNGTADPLDKHHIFGGAYRKKSEKLGLCVAIIEALAASERRQTKEERKKAEELAAKEKQQRTEHEHAREELMIILVQCGWASIALGEAAARALQRGHTNGDTEAALEYAAKVKHELKRFLAEQGVHAMLE